jgi:uncharacterized protein YndB with AHSA1/START domain
MREVTTHIDAPADDVWHIIIDTEQWSQWGPTVSAVDYDGRYLKRGATGRIQTALRIWLPFQVDRWEEPYTWGWKVGGVPATIHRVTPIREDDCTLTFLVPNYAFFYTPVCEAALEAIKKLAESNSSQG